MFTVTDSFAHYKIWRVLLSNVLRDYRPVCNLPIFKRSKTRQMPEVHKTRQNRGTHFLATHRNRRNSSRQRDIRTNSVVVVL